jgi:NAD(P)-dependent dehydrogenase (short-subunit alcohol dehydrogenase family)
MQGSHHTIVVTGGSTGIGQSICEHLLAEGYAVLNLARRPATIDHAKLTNIEVDLSDRIATDDTAKKLAKQYRITGLVHNAGLIRANLLEDVQLEDLDYLTQVHIGAAISLSQAFLPAMKLDGFGRIILIGSRAALGLQTRTSYSATKAGMVAITRTWALELGGAGITVNAVAPGPIAATEMFHQVVPENSSKMQEIANSIPVQRLGLPDDVARAVCFFNRPENSFITGQTLMVCGGASLGSVAL